MQFYCYPYFKETISIQSRFMALYNLLTKLSIFWLFLICSSALMSQDIWTGTIDSDWGKGGNWFDGSVPNLSDDVLIQNSDLVILHPDSTGEAKSLFISNGSLLRLECSSLLIIEHSNMDGLENSGVVECKGTIAVSNTTESAIVNNSGAIFTIDTTGRLILDTTGRHGITNSGTFNNLGKIAVDSCVESGIFNLSNFNNLDTISIRNTATWGYYNQGNFINDSLGYISIRNVKDGLAPSRGINMIIGSTLENYGVIEISDIENSAVHNRGTFNNYNTLFISRVEGWGINNYFTLHNYPTAQLSIIDGTQFSGGILNQLDDTIQNEGIIIIDSVGYKGIENNGLLFNHNQIEIRKTGAEAIESENFLMNGIGAKISISEAYNGQSGLRVFGGTLDNHGIIQVNDLLGLGIENQGTFSNYDSIFVDSTGAGFRNSDTLINHQNGVLVINQTTNVVRNGLYNTDNNLIQNHGIIQIQNSMGRGIRNQGTLRNHKSIIINGYSTRGLENEKLFENMSGAEIIISDTIGLAQTGIKNLAGQRILNEGIVDIRNTNSGIENLGFLSNKDSIIVQDIELFAIYNFDTLQNEAGAYIRMTNGLNGIRANSTSNILNNSKIEIENMSGTGMVSAGHFQNNDSITIQNSNFFGIYCEDTLINSIDGVLSISNLTSPDTDGFYCSDCTAINEGLLLIEVIEANGMVLEYLPDIKGMFTNGSTGRLLIDQVGAHGIRIEKDAHFINEDGALLQASNIQGHLLEIKAEGKFTGFPNITIRKD